MPASAIKRRARRTTDDAAVPLKPAPLPEGVSLPSNGGKPEANSDPSNVASVAPHWLLLRREQDDDMKAKTWKEAYARALFSVQCAAAYLLLVSLIHNGFQLVWAVTFGAAIRVIAPLHRRFAAHVMQVRKPFPPELLDETSALNAHRTSTVLNTHRRIQLPDSEPIDPRELQLIFDPTSARSIPPFPPGTRYRDPLFNKHVATAVGSQRPYVPNSYYRESIPSDHDGCTVCIDWLFSIPPTSAIPDAGRRGIVGLIPGLASSSHSPYIETMCRYLAPCGYHAAVINGRGMGSTPLDRPSLLTGVFTDDIRTAVNRVFDTEGLKQRLGIEGPLFLAGFSLGGAMLCKYLGEEGQRGNKALLDRVHGAVACCAPWDFHESSNHMLTVEAQLVYAPHLSKGLREYVERHREMCKQIREIDVEHLLLNPSLTRTVQDIDSLVVAPHAGFASREDYYNAATPMPYLEAVEVPVLCLTAADDPITGPPPKDARWERLIDLNPNVCYVKAPAGGHLGFLMGFLDETRGRSNFMERTVSAFFDQCRARRERAPPTDSAEASECPAE